jgi:hypothetical protein
VVTLFQDALNLRRHSHKGSNVSHYKCQRKRSKRCICGKENPQNLSFHDLPKERREKRPFWRGMAAGSGKVCSTLASPGCKRLQLFGKLTSFLQLQEFSQRNQTWELRVFNLDGAPITSNSHTHPSHLYTSRLLTLSLSLDVPASRPTQCTRDT